MIRIPLYLAVAQWALLAALGVFLLVLFRQLGHLMNGQGKTSALGPAAGTLAPPLGYLRPGEPDDARLLRPGAGQPLLLAFVDPTCPSCEELVRVLGSLSSAGELSGVRTLLLISDPVSYLRISPAFTETDLEIGRPAKPAELDAYRVSATPLLVAIDGFGTVRAAGSAIRAAEVLQYVISARTAAEPAAATKGEAT
ncbi:MAG TPA: hypothetical protein VMA95_13690 [Streptosporangiaceae bacterium]|nr:hypothetical protein [Streptosporangiaceae bacterium]